MTTKRIWIYGDSNTYGYDARTGGRFGKESRWPDICQDILGDEYKIIAEGLNGRNTCHDDPMDPMRNGLAYVKSHLIPHLPLDVICVKLGSNDLDASLAQMPEMIAENAARVLKKARDFVEERVREESEGEPAGAPSSSRLYVLMAPLEITEDVFDGPFGMYYERSVIETSRQTTEAFRRQAEKDGFRFFNTNDHARCGKLDGVHLDEENHRKLGKAFAEWIKEIAEYAEAQ